jgi:hypothetical protein
MSKKHVLVFWCRVILNRTLGSVKWFTNQIHANEVNSYGRWNRRKIQVFGI